MRSAFRFGSPTILLLIFSAGIGFAQSLITQSNVTSLKQVWHASTGSAIVAVPAVTRATSVEMVFVGAQNGALYAINAGTGQILWTFQTGGPIVLSAQIAVANQTPYVYVVSSDGCLYAFQANTGAPIWKQCYMPSSTEFISLTPNTPDVLVAFNIAGAGGETQTFDAVSGALKSTSTSPQPYSSLLPITNIETGITQSGGSLCPSSSTVTAWTVQAIGATVQVSPTFGPGSTQTINLGSNVSGAGTVFVESSYSTVTRRDPRTGFLYTCLTQYRSADIFFPLVSGAVSAVFISDIGQVAANGSENVGASSDPLLFLYDQSDPTRLSGIVFAASTAHTLAILIPSGTVDTIFTGQGNVTGSVSDGYSPSAPMRLYFADSGGNVYALSATGS